MASFGIIDEALDVLKVTQGQLSIRYLGRSHGYVSSIKAQKRDVSTAAMSNLSQLLRPQIRSIGTQDLPEKDRLSSLLKATEHVLMQQAVLSCHSKNSAARELKTTALKRL